ncbi:MOSC domain-containing protein [Microbacterium paraoxydans]|uniref:MOSC domain-containing protein n=1 Tax=Microbacterium paraoxydans TaxID=199592 RepID=UPI001CFC30A1|nr:MOSC domain-containing protein [Microbacterium paraoxydans]
MDANRIVVDSIVRYPVKGLAGVTTAKSVHLEPGGGLRWDRSFAIARDASTPSDAGWRPREEFFHLARHEHIARFTVDLADAETASPTLTVTAPNGESAKGRIGDFCSGEGSVDERIDALLRRTLADDTSAPRLVATTAAGLWDWPRAHLSIINRATLEALGREAEVPVDPRRVRGNLYLTGLEPFAEFALVGRRIRVGDVELEVFQPTDRCRATTIRPGDGVSDLNVPALLGSRFGHMFCGVYARVVTAGSLCAGDAVEDAGPLVGSPLAGEPGWPRTARLVDRRDESRDVVSFWFADPLHVLDAAAPGTHVRLHLPGGPTPNWRSYTISAVAQGRFRISVKRDGRVSTLLHDAYPVGSEILVTGPHGDQTEDDGGRDLLLVSAGIGITPTTALLRSRAMQGKGGRVRVVHTERSIHSLPLWREVCDTVAALGDGTATLHLTRDAPPATPVGFTAVAGRPDRAALATALADLDLGSAEAFVCGPRTFASSVRAMLVELGFASDGIRIDAFYSPVSPDWGPPRIPRAEGPVPVESASGPFMWEPGDGTLLNAAERAGLDWPSECRVGVCGTCVRTVACGEFEYINDPLFEPGAGRLLPCSAAPLTPLHLDGARIESPLDPTGAP